MKSKIVSFCLIIIGLLAYATADSQTKSSEWKATTESGCELKGTLMNAGKGSPVALIIAGSGPTDRDGNNMNMKNNSLKMLADSLGSLGISTLRYDKRVLNQGDPNCMESESDLRFEILAEDAVILIEALRTSGNFSDIFIIGHSEGSLLGMLATKMTAVDGFISIAGSGIPADQIIYEQLETQIAPATLAQARGYLDTLKSGELVEDVNPMLGPLFRPSVQPYLISWFAYDPKEEVSGLNVPVLIIDAGNDIQVEGKHGDILAEASETEKVHFPKMTHVLKEAESTQAGLATYTDPNLPLQEGLAQVIHAFIESVEN